MYLKRILVATTIGFLWYVSDYGEVTLQLGVLICVLLSLTFFKRSVECSTQTDELAESPPCQVTFILCRFSQLLSYRVTTPLYETR